MSSYQSFYTTAQDTTAMSVFGALYYGSLLILVIFLILLVVHFTVFPIFALTADEPGIIVISGTADREMAFTKQDATPMTARNKNIPRTALPDICNYTIGIDVTMNQNIVKYDYPIPILYRATAGLSTLDAKTVTPAAFSGKYGSTNIIIWANGIQKDIFVTLITTDANNATVEKTTPKGITPDFTKTFRLAVVVADSFVEVYVNGSLKATLNTSLSLKQIQHTDFYPPVVDDGGITVGNMSMWPRILTSKEIRTYESTPMS